MGFVAGALLLLLCCFPQTALPFTADEISARQSRLREIPIGDRVVFWAEQFIGTHYDMDPLGEYVRRAVIVADERVDCMYLTFRTVELALANGPEEAIDKALFMRFHTRGILKEGRVINYDDRYRDGVEMVNSGKYGDEITAQLGEPHYITAPRGGDRIGFLPTGELRRATGALQTGDIIFFIKDPSRREAEEVVAHTGIVSKDQRTGEVCLIHASGTKKRGGSVKKIPLNSYLANMQHIGAKVLRFKEGVR